jgi:hypothetical protein
MERLGILVVRWAFVETRISDLFAALTEGNTVAMLVVTANVSQRSITGWIRTLLDTRDVPPILADKIRAALDDVDEVRAERNAFVHGVWSTTGPAMSAIVQTVRLERKAIIHEVVVTPSDLDHLIDLVEEIAMKLGLILRAMGSAAA